MFDDNLIESRSADGADSRASVSVPDEITTRVEGRPAFRRGQDLTPAANHDRNKILRDQRSILERAEREGRGLTAEERQALDRMDQEFLALEQAAEVVARLGRVRNQERQELEIAGRRVDSARRAATADTGRAARAAIGSVAGDDDAEDPWRALEIREAQAIMRRHMRGWNGRGPFARLTSTPEYAQAFERTVRGDVLALRNYQEERPDLFEAPEHRTITTATSNAPVPTVWEANIVRELAKLSAMRALCPVFSSDSDRKLPIGSTRAAATWWGEAPGGDYTANDPGFALITVDAYMAGVITPIHQTLLDDSSVDMQAFLMAEQADALGEILEDGYVDGSGSSNQPTGFIGQMDAGTITTTASSGVFTADEVITLFHSVPAKWRRDTANTRWLLHDTTLLALRIKKDSVNQYLFKTAENYSDIREGVPGLIYGQPYALSDSMPYSGSTKPVIIVGNWRYCQIWDRGPTRMLINPYTQSRRLIVDFQAWRRTDIKITKTAAFAGLKLKA